jgi:hypothetical protein
VPGDVSIEGETQAMNEEKLQSLGQRVVRCRYWRWLPGMLTLTGHRVSNEDAETDEPTLFDDDLPDLSDPATVGCLLARVRFALPDPTVFVYSYAADMSVPDSKVLWGLNGMFLAPEQRLLDQPSEVEALVVALELAGKQEGEETP